LTLVFADAAMNVKWRVPVSFSRKKHEYPLAFVF